MSKKCARGKNQKKGGKPGGKKIVPPKDTELKLCLNKSYFILDFFYFYSQFEHSENSENSNSATVKMMGAANLSNFSKQNSS